MELQKFRHKNSKNIKCLLLDIKNFLEKLESGQMEIEACQWELQRNLTNMKCAIEEIRKLKDDIKEMKISNVEAIELIRRLGNKLEYHKTRCAVKKNSRIFDRSEKEYVETDNGSKVGPLPTSFFLKISRSHDTFQGCLISYRKDNYALAMKCGQGICHSGCKRRKCRRIFSKQVEDLSSDLVSHDSACEKKKYSKKYCDKQFENDIKCGNYKAESHVGEMARAVSAFYHEKKQCRKPDKDIMERYLKDSAKYINRHSSHCNSPCTSTTRSVTEHGIYWDKMQDQCNNLQTKPEENCSVESFEQNAEKEYILPKQFFCPKCLKNFVFKCECIRHQIQAHSKPKQKFYYKTCDNVPHTQCKINECGYARVKKNTKNYTTEASVYSCSYCRKVTNSPEQLTAHIRKCRIISRSNLLWND